MSIGDYRSTSEVATFLGITASEVERERKLFGIEPGKMGNVRWWTRDQVEAYDDLRKNFYSSTCPGCLKPLPWPAPKKRTKKAKPEGGAE